MSLATTFPAAMLDTILLHLSALLLARVGGDKAAARDAALQLLAEYRPETADELGLAATIVSCDLAAIDALSQAAAPDFPSTYVLSFRRSAVNLSLEAEKARLRLKERQKMRQSRKVWPKVAAPAPLPVQPAPIAPSAPAKPVVETNRITADFNDEALTWTQAQQQRHPNGRFAAGQRKRLPTLH